MSRILLIRMDGWGDALVLVPLIAALRDAGHSVGAVLTTRNAGVYASRALDRVHVVERRPWPGHGIEAAGAARALEQARGSYDVALIASEEPAAYRFAKDAGIPRRTGFTNGWQKPLKSVWTGALLTTAIVRSASATRQLHEVQTLFRLGQGLHGEPSPAVEVQRLRPLVIDGERKAHGAIVIQASPKYADEGLDVPAMSAIAQALACEREVVLCESPANAAFALEVRARTGLPLTQPGTAAWKALIDGADAIVTPDSGAAHVAGMSGTPCIDLFAQSPQVEHDIARWHPWAAPWEAVVFEPAVTPQAIARSVAAALDRVVQRVLRS